MPPTPPVHRFEVRPRPDQPDPRGSAARAEALTLGLDHPPEAVHYADVYLVCAALDDEQIKRVAGELLADPVTQAATVGAADPHADVLVEVHPLPGVTDPASESVQLAIQAMIGVEAEVRTGRRYDLSGTDADTARLIAERCLANTLVHAIHEAPYHPGEFPHGTPRGFEVVDVPLVDLADGALATLSREAHLFLSVDEMKAIQAEYRRLGREPREIELETLAQTWSEHCVHKTLKATIRYTGELPNAASRPGHHVDEDGSITIANLLKSTVAAATSELMDGGLDWCLSVFVDNAGIIAFDDDHAVCFKVETHNHPSALEPYGGAATGIGGCIRDIIGTGLAARPVAATDVFCVARADRWRRAGTGDDGDDRQAVPAGCLHPRRILTQIVAGVRDYGNRMGIPTLNGAVWFDDDYIGNPLVYCGCVGVMPRDKVKGDPRAGDHIVALGGRTGRDGIHGATFSSAELTDTHADEFSHAVQIGNPITEKKMLDAVLAARDHADGCLYSAITDCGAGGFSSAVGEMGEKLGAEVDLERAPLKYAGLSPTEIWISEAQERMVLAVPAEHLDALEAICDLHDVEHCVLGTFGTDNAELILRYEGTEVGRLSMRFLHEGLPAIVREAAWNGPLAAPESGSRTAVDSMEAALLGLLAHPNIASKRWIIRQYDHEVQGGSVIKPLVGPVGEGPSDAAVIRPVPESPRGLGIANGLATGFRADPYHMTLHAIDECVRNLVCVGVDPTRVAILDNFCWPSCHDPEALGSLVRAAAACYDGAKAYRTPFISGKDSLNNQFTTEEGKTIRIPPTLLISGFGIINDSGSCVTMDAKAAGNRLVLVGPAPTGATGGSHFAAMFDHDDATGSAPRVDLRAGPLAARTVWSLIDKGLVRSAHDCSDGGLAVAAAEMAFAGDLGLSIDLAPVAALAGESASAMQLAFAEEPSRYLLEVSPGDLDALRGVTDGLPGLVVIDLGAFTDGDRVAIAGEVDVAVDELRQAWLGALDW